ncbi:MAG: RNA polymerase factor sigma-54 [Gemmatimonadota bacterium]|nr:RNA polymerase factor sigma-54 [Gemmatimonadota bacterium]
MSSSIRPGMFQGTRARQEAKPNPRLYQAMDLIYMPLLELQTRMEQELSENPFLELSEPDDDEDIQVDEEGQEEPEDEMDWDEILLDGFDVGGTRERYEPREFYQPPAVEERHLHDFLEEQIALLDLDERQRWIATEIIGNIDDDGLLTCSLQEVADGLNGSRETIRDAAIAEAGEIEDEEARQAELEELESLFAPHTTDEIETVLDVVQSLDPPGVGGHDLGECLRIQLARANRQDSLAFRIVTDHLDDLLNHRWAEISKISGVSVAEVQGVADEVATLDPRPGRQYASSPDQYVIPDLIVDKVGGEYMVFVNDTGLPRLRLSRTYREVAAKRSSFAGENKEFISSRMNAAQWLIQMIEQRRQTMLRVTRYIVARQQRFFERGVQHLKPLTLREVAQHIGMAESTVSRVTNEKYVQTPTGTYPLKFFFSGGLPTVTGSDISTRGVQAKIRSLVDSEDPQRPLTDQAIVNLLKSEGVKIARRTVAKYRDQLGIVPARMRKRV